MKIHASDILVGVVIGGLFMGWLFSNSWTTVVTNMVIGFIVAYCFVWLLSKCKNRR